MKILFTGASSFTGYWFVKALVEAGHTVTATLQQAQGSYSGLKQQRIERLGKSCRWVDSCSFGSEAFLQLIQSQNWDLLCHHAADVTDYRSPQFNVIKALESNTYRLSEVLEALKAQECRRVVLTGSVFEQDEGAGNEPLEAFSPYGLSKGLTSDYFHYYCHAADVKLGKFVIPNPFGPYEEQRFTAYLMRNWFEGKKATVNSPAYVRDNIHVSLLAKAYAYFIDKIPEDRVFHPSGYVESQGAFTQRFAKEMKQRLGMPCQVDLLHQTEFLEPIMRINTHSLQKLPLAWDESDAWDGIAAYYQSVYQLCGKSS